MRYVGIYRTNTRMRRSDCSYCRCIRLPHERCAVAIHRLYEALGYSDIINQKLLVRKAMYTPTLRFGGSSTDRNRRVSLAHVIINDYVKRGRHERIQRLHRSFDCSSRCFGVFLVPHLVNPSSRITFPLRSISNVDVLVHRLRS